MWLKERAALDQHATRLYNRLGQATHDLRHAQCTMVELRNELGRERLQSEQAIAMLLERNEQLGADAARNITRIEGLRLDQQQGSAEHVGELTRKIDHWRQAYDALERQMREIAEAEHSALRSSIATVHKRLEEERKEVAHRRYSLAQEEGKCADLSRQVEDLNQRLVEAKTERDRERTLRKAMERDLVDLREKLAQSEVERVRDGTQVKAMEAIKLRLDVLQQRSDETGRKQRMQQKVEADALRRRKRRAIHVMRNAFERCAALIDRAVHAESMGELDAEWDDQDG
jgi:chromosome segregation ATPase